MGEAQRLLGLVRAYAHRFLLVLVGEDPSSVVTLRDRYPGRKRLDSSHDILCELRHLDSPVGNGIRALFLCISAGARKRKSEGFRGRRGGGGRGGKDKTPIFDILV